jgi:MSHA biogenesis protein MshQ
LKSSFANLWNTWSVPGFTMLILLVTLSVISTSVFAAKTFDGFTISAQSGSVTAGTGGTVTYTLTGTYTGNGNASCTPLSVSGLPTGVTLSSFSPTGFSATGTTTSQTSILTLTVATTATATTGSAFTVSCPGFSVSGSITISPSSKANQTITFGAAPIITYGGTGTVSATASSGLAVTYSSTTTSVCTVNSSSGLVTAVTTGTCTIAADQAGNASYNAAPQVTQSLVISLLLLADWHMDEASWSGTAHEVADSSGNGYHGRARIAAGSTALPTTASGTSAYTSGSQSTCNYGQFDTSTGTVRTFTYVELSGFPALPTSFTFTAWIRSTNASAQHQRILVRDDADNGWGLSLADGTGQAKLRFFNRNITNSGSVTGQGSNPGCGVFCLDTNAVVSSNTWHFIAAAIDTTGKTITLYVYDSTGVLKAKSSSAFSGTWKDGTATAAIGGEPSASSEGRQTSWHFLGNIDELQIYRGALVQADIEGMLSRVRACVVTGFDHLRIEHSGSGVTCAPTTLTIKTCANADCSSLHTGGGVTGTLTATGTPVVNWVGDASFNIGVSGVYTKNAQVTTAGSVTWGATGVAPVATNGTRCYIGGTASCSFTASLAGFIFDVPNHVSDTAQSISVRAVKQSDNSLACTPAFDSGSKTVNFNCGYGNPASGTLPVKIGGNNLACGTASGINLSFTNGVASTTVQYADVGQVSLTANYTGSSGSEAGLVMNGSDTFIAAPKDFAISNVTSGPIKAGTSFGATVTARNNSGNATPNFGKETAAEGATLIRTRCQPTGTGTSDGSFSGTLGSFNNGSASSSNLNWSEVGNIDLTATLTSGSYLGSGLGAAGNTGTGGVVCLPGSAGNVGRFYPDHFDTAITSASGVPMVCPVGLTCPPLYNGMVYAGQPVTVTVTARNQSGGTTANYSGNATPAFSKAVTLNAFAGLGSTSILSGTSAGTLPGNTIAAADFSAGSATASPRYNFTSPPGTPTDIYLRATEDTGGDGVSSLRAINPTTTSVEGGVKVAQSRISLSNVFGNGRSALQMPIRALFWSGSSWVPSATDTSSLTQSAVALSPTTNISGFSWINGTGFITLDPPASSGHIDVALNLGATSAALASCVVSSGGTAANMSWLRSPNGCAATYDRDPSARATFGIYAPETRKSIHVREAY